MTKLAIKYVSIVLTIYLLSKIIDTVYIGKITSLLAMAFILLIVNLLVKPLLLLLTLPLSLITLGLFNFIVNAWTIMIADRFVSEVNMGGFLNSLIAALIIAVIQHFIRENNKASYRKKIDININR